MTQTVKIENQPQIYPKMDECLICYGFKSLEDVNGFFPKCKLPASVFNSLLVLSEKLSKTEDQLALTLDLVIEEIKKVDQLD